MRVGSGGTDRQLSKIALLISDRRVLYPVPVVYGPSTSVRWFSTGTVVYGWVSAEQQRDQTMNDRKCCRHERPPRTTIQQVYLNSSTVANGSADHGRKRWSVNFVFCPGCTSTST